VNFGQPEDVPPRGNVYLHPRLGVLLIASNLPPLDADRAYEMWIIPPDGAPRPAGLFQATGDGTAVHLLSQQIDLAQVGAVAVTEEPSAGSPGPTSTPIIVAAAGA
jgi:anti-sigma-K factor RskA